MNLHIMHYSFRGQDSLQGLLPFSEAEYTPGLTCRLLDCRGGLGWGATFWSLATLDSESSLPLPPDEDYMEPLFPEEQ